MSKLRGIAKTIRHAPGLEQAEWLWDALRRPYEQVLNLGGRGVSVSIGGCCTVPIPAAYSGQLQWESYEPETVATVMRWIEANSNSLVIDVGSAIGVFSLIALSVSSKTKVIAWDSDLPSVKATEKLCQYVDQDRLRLVYGFAAAQHESNLTLSEIDAQVHTLFEHKGITGAPGTTAYVCLHGDSDEAIPTYSVDGVFFSEPILQRSILLKCDVEGAELLVLQGALRLLQELSPVLLISVHPPALPNYGHSVQGIREFLEQLSYSIEIVAIDHEEHWWCQKLA